MTVCCPFHSDKLGIMSFDKKESPLMPLVCIIFQTAMLSTLEYLLTLTRVIQFGKAVVAKSGSSAVFTNCRSSAC